MYGKAHGPWSPITDGWWISFPEVYEPDKWAYAESIGWTPRLFTTRIQPPNRIWTPKERMSKRLPKPPSSPCWSTSLAETAKMEPAGKKQVVAKDRSWHRTCWWFRNPKQPPGMFLKPWKYWDQLPTYQLVSWSRISGCHQQYDPRTLIIKGWDYFA